MLSYSKLGIYVANSQLQPRATLAEALCGLSENCETVVCMA